MKLVISCVLFSIVISVSPQDSESNSIVPKVSIEAVANGIEPLQEESVSSTDDSAVSEVKQSLAPTYLTHDAEFIEQNTSESSPKEKSGLVLPEGAPDWVREHQVSEDGIRFSIPTMSSADAESCYDEFQAHLLSEVRKQLDQFYLKAIPADQLPELTLNYVQNFWLVKDREFLSKVDLPSGSYHQLWKQVYISKEQLKIVNGWEQRRILDSRMKEVGSLGGLSVLVMVGLSGLVGVLAKREKAKS